MHLFPGTPQFLKLLGDWGKFCFLNVVTGFIDLKGKPSAAGLL